MKKKHLHFTRTISAMLLWVFCIALTPWSAFHNHPEDTHNCKNEKMCMHRLHISNRADNCLICSAHFEKNYTQTFQTYRVSFSIRLPEQNFVLVRGSYAEIKTLSLRGPPAA